VEKSVSTGVCADRASCAPRCDLGDNTACATLRSKVERDCDRTAASACLDASDLEWTGIGGERNVKKSAESLDRACKAKVALACFKQGWSFGMGVSGDPDVEKGKQLVQQALSLLDADCRNAGVGDACARESDVLRGGVVWRGTIVFPPDAARSAELSQRGCELDDPISCLVLARSIPLPPAPNADAGRAIGLVKRACEKGTLRRICDDALNLAVQVGDLASTNTLGTRYLHLAKRDCKAGDPIACYETATYYVLGRGGMTTDGDAALAVMQDGLRSLVRICRHDWDGCLRDLDAVWSQPAADRAQIEATLMPLLKTACASRVWQACALGLRWNIVTRERLGDVLVEKCRAKNGPACIELAMQLPDRFAGAKEMVGARCNTEGDGDACLARGVEATWPLPAPHAPTASLPGDAAAWMAKACKKAAIGCLLAPAPAIYPGARPF
jgi:TPR repeat protein